MITNKDTPRWIFSDKGQLVGYERDEQYHDLILHVVVPGTNIDSIRALEHENSDFRLLLAFKDDSGNTVTLDTLSWLCSWS